MLEVFRDYYGITPQDDPRTVREKIAGRLLLLDESFRDALPIIFENFGAADPNRPGPRDGRGGAAASGLLRAAPRRCAAKASRSSPSSTTSTGSTRPASSSSRSGWTPLSGGAIAAARELPSRVPRGLDAALVVSADRARAARARGDPGAARRSARQRPERRRARARESTQRTGGNPFFTEEVVQGLIESGKLEGTRGAYRLIESRRAARDSDERARACSRRASTGSPSARSTCSRPPPCSARPSRSRCSKRSPSCRRRICARRSTR